MKKETWFLLMFTASLLVSFEQVVTAQEKTQSKKELKNTIHFNLTNPVIFGSRSIVFGYERVINHRRSFSVNFGTTDFPSGNIINADSIKAKTIRDETGYNISADYRFYLAKENKFAAPRGVYIGPYYSYNTFNKKHTWTVKQVNGNDVNMDSDLKLNIHTFGVELGYQFVFWNRLAVDMILVGPGVSGYKLKASLGSNLSQADKEKLFEKINDALADKFPGYNLVIKEGDFKKSGKLNTTSFGYRYMIQIGFRF